MDTSASLRIRSACVVLRGAGEGGGDAWSAVERERVGRVHRQARWDRPEAESVAELLRGHVDGVDVALELGDAWCEPGPSAPARRAGKERRRKRHALPKSPRRLSRVISLSSVRDVSVQSGCDGSDGGGRQPRVDARATLPDRERTHCEMQIQLADCGETENPRQRQSSRQHGSTKSWGRRTVDVVDAPDEGGDASGGDDRARERVRVVDALLVAEQLVRSGDTATGARRQRWRRQESQGRGSRVDRRV